MRLFGLSIQSAKTATPVPTRGTAWRVLESFTGAWQKNVEVNFADVMSSSAVYSCVTLIANDIAKMPLRLVELTKDGIWVPVESASFSPFLLRPNRYQTRIEFVQQWVVSKLAHGNAYALKERDARGVVVAAYVLDPREVTPLVANDGQVLYQLRKNTLTRSEDVAIPASEIFHDKSTPLYHPLVGVSPLYASGLSATHGLEIQRHGAKFFKNAGRPSGVLTAPGLISDETAARLKSGWDEKFSGDNAGKVAVLGDGLRFETMSATAVDSEMSAQMRASAESVCSTFHVPPYKIGLGALPTYNNAQIMNQIYYDDCLQTHIESIEAHLDYGLGLDVKKDGRKLGCEFDITALMRMDTASQVDSLTKEVAGGIRSPNEARRERGLPPVIGGESPLMQEQNYSLAALAKRDAKPDPFASEATPAPSTLAAAVGEPSPLNDNAGKNASMLELAAMLDALPVTEYVQ